MTDRTLRWMLLGIQLSILGVGAPILLPGADGVFGIAIVTVIIGAGVTGWGFLRTLGDGN